uniref:Uncharacterized protein n=1 Tax=Arundo donax TaxID=35708 RepID=A0A0A8YZ09_ARUDO
MVAWQITCQGQHRGELSAKSILDFGQTINLRGRSMRAAAACCPPTAKDASPLCCPVEQEEEAVLEQGDDATDEGEVGVLFLAQDLLLQVLDFEAARNSVGDADVRSGSAGRRSAGGGRTGRRP